MSNNLERVVRYATVLAFAALAIAAGKNQSPEQVTEMHANSARSSLELVNARFESMREMGNLGECENAKDAFTYASEAYEEVREDPHTTLTDSVYTARRVAAHALIDSSPRCGAETVFSDLRNRAVEALEVTPDPTAKPQQ